MKTITRSLGLVLAGWLVLGPQGAWAQGVFFVTGLSQPGAAALTTPEGAELSVSVGRSVVPGTLQLADGATLMLFDPSGLVIVVLGPATVAVTRDDIRAETRLALREGKLLFGSAQSTGARDGLNVTAVVSEQPAVNLEFRVGLGRTYIAVGGGRAGLAYLADGGPDTLGARVNATSVTVATGQLLTVTATGAHEVGPLGDWPAREGFRQDWGRQLGVESARESRRDVEANLFHNIIAWDRYAGAGHVVPRLEPPRFNPEIRTTIQTVTTPSRPATRSQSTQTTPFPGANAVPTISPAAASVQNLQEVGQGVTATLLSSNAATLLLATGSQGLGFGGPSRLSIPGFTGGVRTVGPAGLGAQP